MVTELTVLKSVHILAAAVWVGSGFALNMAMLLGARSGNAQNMLAGLRLAQFFGKYVFPPVSLVTLVTGIWMTDKYYDWGELWIGLGLAGLVLSTAIGIFCLGPKAAVGVAAMERGDPPPPGRNWVPIVARLNLLIVSAVLVLMVIRPT